MILQENNFAAVVEDHRRDVFLENGFQVALATVYV